MFTRAVIRPESVVKTGSLNHLNASDEDTLHREVFSQLHLLLQRIVVRIEIPDHQPPRVKSIAGKQQIGARVLQTYRAAIQRRGVDDCQYARSDGVI